MTVTFCFGAAGGDGRVRLLPGEYSIGRRATEVDIVPADDKSIRHAAAHSVQLRARSLARAPSAPGSLLTLLRSRKHAVIRVTAFPPGSVTDLDALPLVELRDDSSLGTLVNRERLPKGEFVPIHHNDELQFGTSGGDTVCRLDLQPVVCCVPSLTPKLLPLLVPDAARLVAHLTRDWSPHCTHVLVPASAAQAAAGWPADASCAAALYAGAPVLRLAWLGEGGLQGADAEQEMSSHAVQLTHLPTWGDSTPPALLPPAATYPARHRGALLNGVCLLFAPAAPGGGGGGGDRILSAALAAEQPSLSAAAQLAGAQVAVLGTEEGDETADIAKSGGAAARGILLVLPEKGQAAALAALRRSDWAALDFTDTHRLLSTLLSANLGALRIPGTGGGGGAAAAAGGAGAAAGGGGGKKRAAAEDSDTGEEDEADATARHKSARTLGGGTQATQATAGGGRGWTGRCERPAEGEGPSSSMPPPPPRPLPAKKAAPKGRNAALAIALQMEKNAQPEEEEQEEPELKCWGALEFAPLVVRPAAAAAAAPRAAAASGVPNFKRFRKVACLPSSSNTFALLVPVARDDAFQAREEDAAAAETKRRAEIEKEAKRLFAAKIVPQKAKPAAKAKPKAKAKTKDPLAFSDSDE